MRSGREVYRFGPFELDSGRRRLSRGREPVALSGRQVEILLLLVSNAGQVVSKDALTEAGWRGTAVSDNSVSAAPEAQATRQDAKDVDTAMVNAAILALEGKHSEAASVCGEALAHAGPGSAGWLLPVEPLLDPTARRETWAQTLAILCDRAV